MNDTVYQIHLLDKMQKHTYYFVKSDSKEHALSFFIKQSKINLDNYSLVLVVDLTKSISIDSQNCNSFDLRIVDDKLETYSQIKNKSNLNINQIIDDFLNNCL